MEYFIHDGTTQSGPFTKEEIKSKYNQPGYFTWKEGMQEWEPVASLFPQPKKESMPPVMATPANVPVAKDAASGKSKSLVGLILPVVSLILAVALGITSYSLFNRLEQAKEKNKIIHLQGYGSDFMVRALTFENNLPKIYVQRLANYHDAKSVYTLKVKYYDAQRNLIRLESEVDFTYLSKITLDNATPEVSEWAFSPGHSKASAFLLPSMSKYNGPGIAKVYPTPALRRGDYYVEIWEDDRKLFTDKLSIP